MFTVLHWSRYVVYKYVLCHICEAVLHECVGISQGDREGEGTYVVQKSVAPHQRVTVLHPYPCSMACLCPTVYELLDLPLYIRGTYTQLSGSLLSAGSGHGIYTNSRFADVSYCCV